MGNSSSSTREGHARTHPRNTAASPTSPTSPVPPPPPGTEPRLYSSRNPRVSSRHDLSFLLAGRDRTADRGAQPEPRRETKQEREARKLEKERVARAKERERSIREEGVDGGFLVTLGTYTGPEDFNKAVVRGLMIERRLAPFWKGLNDHSESWTQHQLVAAVRGLPIPAADDIPPEVDRPESPASRPVPSDATLDSLTIPIGGRSQSYQSDRSGTPLPTSRPSSSFPNSSSFRGRAKTLASPFTSKTTSSSPAPQEIHLPEDPYINGSPIEAYLYKDAAECPICFLYYPPYLNRTRCCDQSICSECFVQIKRPDPHAPEHHDDPSNPTPPPPPEEEGLLVSEPSACPFCVTPEFGVTYEAPPFRRGLVYSGPAARNPLSSSNSAMASTASLSAPIQGRRRTTSLSASAPQVITTDRVRPDWAKKLADARAHALRRSAAATALHNAAYMLGNAPGSDTRNFAIGRRRRTILRDGPVGSGSGSPARLPDSHPLSHLSGLILQNEGQTSDSDAAAGRSSSRRDRVQDLEDLMMMEAIRMSLASEEERKKREDKDAKKAEKQRAKDAKKAEKSMRKNGAPYSPSANASTLTWSSMTRSTSNLGQSSVSPPASTPLASLAKGKGPAATLPIGTREPVHTQDQPSGTKGEPVLSLGMSPSEHAQRHLEAQRATLSQTPSQHTLPQPIPLPTDHKAHLRHLSNASSVASSIGDSNPGSYQRPSELGRSSDNAAGLDIDNGISDTPEQSGTPSNGAGIEPMFNFRSLAAMIDKDEKHRDSEHNEFASLTPEQQASRNASIASSSKRRYSDADLKIGGEASAVAHQPPSTADNDATTAGAERDLAPMTLPDEGFDVRHGEAIFGAPHRESEIMQ